MPPPFVIHDPEFLRALGEAPRLACVVGVDAHEGPVYIADADILYFTSLPTPDWRVAIRRIALDAERFPLAAERVETVVQQTRVANGMTLDFIGEISLPGAVNFCFGGRGQRALHHHQHRRVGGHARRKGRYAHRHPQI